MFFFGGEVRVLGAASERIKQSIYSRGCSYLFISFGSVKVTNSCKPASQSNKQAEEVDTTLESKFFFSIYSVSGKSSCVNPRFQSRNFRFQ